MVEFYSPLNHELLNFNIEPSGKISTIFVASLQSLRNKISTLDFKNPIIHISVNVEATLSSCHSTQHLKYTQHSRYFLFKSKISLIVIHVLLIKYENIFFSLE